MKNFCFPTKTMLSVMCIVSSIIGKSAYALTCSSASDGVGIVGLVTPPAPLIVNNKLPIGSVIATLDVNIPHSTQAGMFTCSGIGADDNLTSLGGETGIANVFQTGIPGVGYTAGFIGGTTCEWGKWPRNNCRLVTANPTAYDFSRTLHRGQFKIELIKTGAISAGIANPDIGVFYLNPRIVYQTIRWAGQLIVSPSEKCTLENPAPVPLGNIFRNQLQTAGSHSQWIPFNLYLTDCSDTVVLIETQFNGTSDSNDTALYKNNGTATNVGVKLADRNEIALGNGSVLYTTKNTVGSTLEIPLQARIETPLGNASGGTVSAAVTVTMSYQ